MSKVKKKPKPFMVPIMGTPYEFRYVQDREDMPHTADDDDRESAGCTDIYARNIYLNGPELTKKRLSAESTMLHEMIHAILAESGMVEQIENIDPKGGLEEGIVCALENGLIRHLTFRDPKLKAILSKKK